MIFFIIAALAFFAGWCFGFSADECPLMIQGYRCKGDFCNHSKYEVRKAKEIMHRNDPPNFKFRP